jgi:RNA polymerase sigma-70 factor (ECF subfamily)
MLGPSADIEDVVQEVFLQVHRSMGDFRGQAKFSTWLHRVTVNVVLMVRRAARSRPVLSGDLLTEREPSEGLWPDEDAARRARVAAFQRLVDRLPEKKRTVFILHEIEGQSPAEIAQLVDAPVLTVRTRLFDARRELAAMMRDEPQLAQLAEDIVRSAQSSNPETEAT